MLLRVNRLLVGDEVEIRFAEDCAPGGVDETEGGVDVAERFLRVRILGDVEIEQPAGGVACGCVCIRHDADRRRNSGAIDDEIAAAEIVFIVGRRLVIVGERPREIDGNPIVETLQHGRRERDHSAAVVLRSLRRRKALAKARRELGAQEPVELDVRDGKDRLDALLEEGFALEGSGWKSRRSTAIVSDPVAHSFYVDVARWAAGAGLLRLCFLRVRGRAVAFELVLDDGRSLYDLKGGYDPGAKRFMPGFLMAEDLLRHGAELGRETFEFLGTAESFKLEWTSRTRQRVAFSAFAPTLAGRTAYVAHAYARPVAKRALWAARRLRRARPSHA